MSQVLQLWRRLGGGAFGQWVFSRIVCAKAPYFATIAPRFRVLEPGR